jgi:hypothetical protein
VSNILGNVVHWTLLALGRVWTVICSSLAVIVALAGPLGHDPRCWLWNEFPPDSNKNSYWFHTAGCADT